MSGLGDNGTIDATTESHNDSMHATQDGQEPVAFDQQFVRKRTHKIIVD